VPPSDPIAFTDDTLLHGGLRLRQPARGLRANIDPVLLAAFAARTPPPRRSRTGPPPVVRAADHGAGTGVVALLLMRAGRAGRFLCVEADPVLADIARHNARANGFGRTARVLHADLRDPLPDRLARRFHLVVANPPYLPLDTGHVSPDPLRAAARHEVRGGLDVFAAAARRLLRPDGRFALIYPWRRREHALETLARHDLHPLRERRHLRLPGARPGVVCLECGAAAGTPPAVETLVVHDPAGGYAPTIRRFLAGDYGDGGPSTAASSAAETAPTRTIR
jgi:tRNA1Val (adenine37-N6)-methyltransferase